jgi:hypothetical protein
MLLASICKKNHVIDLACITHMNEFCRFASKQSN